VPGSPDSFHYVFFNIEGVTITFGNLLERSHCLNLGLIEEACPNLYQEAIAVFSPRRRLESDLGLALANQRIEIYWQYSFEPSAGGAAGFDVARRPRIVQF
jgi:hypothetical protein